MFMIPGEKVSDLKLPIITNVKDVIENDLCIGCGACAALAPHLFKIYEDDLGRFQAKALSESQDFNSDFVNAACPFSSKSVNENELAKLFLDDKTESHDRIGNFLECYAGRVTSPAIYSKSSSGGLCRWFLAKLLEEKLVDYVVHVVENKDSSDSTLFKYQIDGKQESVLNGSTSAYYPVEMSKVLGEILNTPGRFAITGVPCFIKAIRNLCLLNPDLRSKIHFTAGIVCGHLKSKFYAEMIGWQLGVAPEDLARIDFRVKLPNAKANEKGVAASSDHSANLKSNAKKVQQIFGTNYGHGYFKYNACDYCDDVLAETSDISFGDAWLPEFLDKGTSLVIVRSKKAAEVIENGIRAKELELQTLSATQAARSQDAGLRHRREGLSYRLFLKQKMGKPLPQKRVPPSSRFLTKKQQKIHRLRLKLAESSFKLFVAAKCNGNWDCFEKPMAKLNKEYLKVQDGYLVPVIKFFLPKPLIKTILYFLRR